MLGPGAEDSSPRDAPLQGRGSGFEWTGVMRVRVKEFDTRHSGLGDVESREPGCERVWVPG